MQHSSPARRAFLITTICQITCAFLSINSASAYIKAGTLRPLAVLSDISPDVAMSAPAFGAFIQAQYRMWQDIVSREGIKADEPSATQ